MDMVEKRRCKTQCKNPWKILTHDELSSLCAQSPSYASLQKSKKLAATPLYLPIIKQMSLSCLQNELENTKIDNKQAKLRIIEQPRRIT
ncbi:hypothetical protein EUGRSUZ_E00222 [Eucalyptus grandis]|uniref:Uncharacterized protein n=2 Tax=Eucalyptus grandis TaxID=71139 RepID=A0ACC3KRV2_EUCGR|nr:hypothetical protein EUGRSUZ_E00222 [Eucalyptus grandis]